jgi:hypothetical protein
MASLPAKKRRLRIKIPSLGIFMRSLFLSKNELEKFANRSVMMLKGCTFSAKCADFLVFAVRMSP